MPYVDLAGLSRYASRQKDRLERDYALLRDMQWTRTDKAGAVSLWPVGGTPLLPTVDFLFTEVPPASGDKGPDNPSTIAGVNSVKVMRCNANMLPIRNSGSQTSATTAGVPWTKNGDGTYTFSGTATNTGNTSGSSSASWHLMDIGIPKGRYSFGLIEGSANVYLMVGVKTNGTTKYIGATGGSPKVVEIADGTTEANIYFQVVNGTTYNEIVTPYLCVEGAVADSVNEGTDYTISLGNTYYGGTLNVATGVMTVTHYGVVLTGAIEPSFSTLRDGGLFEAQYDNLGIPEGLRYKRQTCSHLNYNSSYNTTYEHFYMAGKLYLWINVQTKEDFMAWLTGQNIAGTPVTFVYEVATPYTVQLTPAEILSLSQPDKYTPRVNTVYTDAKSVQVGYVKSPIREEFEIQQAIVAQGGNV